MHRGITPLLQLSLDHNPQGGGVEVEFTSDSGIIILTLYIGR